MVGHTLMRTSMTQAQWELFPVFPYSSTSAHMHIAMDSYSKAEN